MSRALTYILGSLPCIAVGVLIGFVIWGTGVVDIPRELHSGSDHSFINPLLQCEFGQNISDTNLRTSRREVESLIAQHQDAGKITNAAVYYRDLNNGPWFGIQEKDPFIPASLLKFPLIISLYKQAEVDPDLLMTQIEYGGSQVSTTQFIKPTEEIQPGNTYTIEDLAERALKYSDNNAALVISEVLGLEKVKEVYGDLGLDKPTDLGTFQLSVRAYASFFRVLYNASYLTDASSEKLLGVLSTVHFQDGLVAGVPQNTTVSHKFGEVELSTGEKQLHDCGIIYHPKHPYLLCVMSRGNNLNNLMTFIKDVSAIVYSNVNS